MLQNAFFYHFQAEHFPFLGLQASTVAKSRSLFYTALARFLLVDSGDEEERFKAFILPLSGRKQVFSFIVMLIPLCLNEGNAMTSFFHHCTNNRNNRQIVV